jgi:hypothetical protein
MSYSNRHERILLEQEKTLKKRHAAHEKTRAVDYYEDQLRSRDSNTAQKDAQLHQQEVEHAGYVTRDTRETELSKSKIDIHQSELERRRTNHGRLVGDINKIQPQRDPRQVHHAPRIQPH